MLQVSYFLIKIAIHTFLLNIFTEIFLELPVPLHFLHNLISVTLYSGTTPPFLYEFICGQYCLILYIQWKVVFIRSDNKLNYITYCRIVLSYCRIVIASYED